MKRVGAGAGAGAGLGTSRRAGPGGRGRARTASPSSTRPQGLGPGRRTTASGGDGASSRRSSSTRSGPTRCGCSSPISSSSQFGVQTMAEYGWRFGRMATDDTQGGRERHLRPAARWARTRRSPGWPPASSGSSCPTSSTTSRSTSRWPTSRRPATAADAVWHRLAADLREPPAIPQGGRLLAAVAIRELPDTITHALASSGSTRSWAIGAGSSRS